ncbi:ATP-dependent helicase [Enterocloster citroniae]|uniref:ATP-dependent helicase n=1 Tax=Enterocloster citroniae TaxID=358743 RepID=UPI00189A4946|nr:ATP-dependent helicase [Enterocloster citroniae]
MAFNETQKKAIRHRQGPMLVLAGPGSGKTTVITNRVRYLTEKAGVDPGHILVITFTRAAAREMKERYEQMTQAGCSRVSFGTFHSVFFLILKLAYRYQAANIVREEQRIQFVRELLEHCDLEVEDEGEFIASVLSEISMVKGELMDLDHYYAKNCSEDVFKQLFLGYEEQLRKRRLLDFDDMLVMCYQLFKERPDILSAWQNKYKYILIDEFQDINRIQYEIVRMLADPENNLFIVGDDDQSIYRFRGAKPEIMLGFERDYPDAPRLLLDQNYRSSRQIVEAAGNVIRHNRTRFPKDIRAARGNGRPLDIREWPEPIDESLAIAGELRDYASMGIAYEDMAVLYRTNLGPRLLIEKLMEYNIPFNMRDTVPNLYDHWIVKNVLSYIKAATGDLSRSNILTIINRPKRYVSRDALEGQMVNWEAVKSFYQDKNWMLDRIEQLEYDLIMLKTMAPAAAVNYIRKAVDYDSYLREYAGERRMKPEELLEVLDQLQESAAGFKTYDAWFAHMDHYRDQLLKQAQGGNGREKGVSLMTMHSSKGLEFRVVYILDANEGITPHHKAVLDPDVEEERRMFYVAMTRAKERLHIYYVRERYHKKQEKSRFAEEAEE